MKQIVEFLDQGIQARENHCHGFATTVKHVNKEEWIMTDIAWNINTCSGHCIATVAANATMSADLAYQWFIASVQPFVLCIR